MSTLKLRRDDVVIEEPCTYVFYLVLAIGARTFDLIEQCGGTTRYRHADGRGVRVAVDADFNNDAAYRSRVVAELRREAAEARSERKRGDGRRRGHVTRYPSRTQTRRATGRTTRA